MNTVLQNANDHPAETRAPGFDPVLITVYLGLVVFGMVAVYSATIAQAFETGDPFAYLRTNAVNIAVALAAMLVASQIPIVLLKKCAYLFLFGAILLLSLVLVPGLGVEVNGSTRWIRLGGWIFHPSEFAELMFLIFVAKFLSMRDQRLTSLTRDVMPIVAAFLVIAVLLIKEPDLGSVMVLGAVLMVVLFLSGLRVQHLLLFSCLAIASVVVLILIEPYRVVRVLSFLNPWDDPYNSGFQLVQSLIALGRGEWFGVGLGTSVQKLFYLPYAGSDFLLAVIGEELGFLGIVTVISLFAVLLWKIFHISWLAAAVEDTFAKILAQSIGVLIAVAAIVNIGVNMGSLPTKGLTLPFMSAGGSSLVTYSIAIGIVISIHRESYRKLIR